MLRDGSSSTSRAEGEASWGEGIGVASTRVHASERDARRTASQRTSAVTTDPDEHGDPARADAAVPPWLRVHRHLQRHARLRACDDAHEARWLREAERLQIWTQFGYLHFVEYAERELGLEPRTALDRLRVASALAELPLLEAELEAGTFKHAHVRELVRVVTGDTEAAWIARARDRTYREIQELVAGHRKGASPDDNPDPDLRMRSLRLEVAPQTLALWRQARSVLEAELGHRLEDDELLQLMARRALEPAAASARGAANQHHQIICSSCQRVWQDGGGLRVELDPADAACALCDAVDLGPVDAEPPARPKPTIPPRRRKQALARDGYRCVVPGCRSARHLDVHHIIPRALGGTHAAWNLVTLCSAHHRHHHAGRIVIEGRAPDALGIWFRPPGDEREPGSCTRVHRAERASASKAGKRAADEPMGRPRRETPTPG